ncbi:MAG: tetratricopeptide repeat protein [Blastocatellia bacterium]
MITNLLIAIVLAIAPLWSASAPAQSRSVVEGRITGPDNRPLSDVRVFLQTDTYSPLSSQITDGSGRYRFTNVATGNYYILVEPFGTDYERQLQRVEVNPFNVGRGPTGVMRGGEIFRVDVMLKLAPRKNRDAAPAGVVFHQAVPETAKQEYLNGIKSLEKDDFAAAAASLKRAIEIFPDYYDALETLGNNYVQRREYDPALPILQHAVEVNKDGWRSFYALGVALIETKQRNEGIQALRRAVELNPNSINANMRLGMTLASSEDMRADAIQALTKVAQLDKGKQVPQVYYYLAALYDKNQQYREAADALESFLQTIPPAETEKREKLKKMIEEKRQKASKSKGKN